MPAKRKADTKPAMVKHMSDTKFDALTKRNTNLMLAIANRHETAAPDLSADSLLQKADAASAISKNKLSLQLLRMQKETATLTKERDAARALAGSRMKVVAQRDAEIESLRGQLEKNRKLQSARDGGLSDIYFAIVVKVPADTSKESIEQFFSGFGQLHKKGVVFLNTLETNTVTCFINYSEFESAERILWASQRCKLIFEDASCHSTQLYAHPNRITKFVLVQSKTVCFSAVYFECHWIYQLNT